MRIIYSCSILLLCLVYVSGDQNCGILGDLSGVICITETEYKLSLSDQQIYKCAKGVCVNSPYICQEDVEPSCKLSRSCATCFRDSSSTCVAQKMYRACVNGEMTGGEKYCQASRPYCAMRVGDDGVVNSVCTNIFQQVACDGSNPGPTDPPTESPDDENCNRLGKFPVKADFTCKSYVYCYPDKDGDGNDKIGKMIVVCPTDKVYDPFSQKCVSGRNFVCKNEKIKDL